MSSQARESWSPSQFEFSPYELEATRIPERPPSPSLDGGKRKAGRQKRSSVLCQVAECGIELINEKTYYKRYRICIEHCNMHSMVVEGRRQRFCQQCGRFHDLIEFEGQRKSCRRKLKRHNERRRAAPTKGRKWQSESEDELAMADSEDEAEMKAVANIKRGTARTRTMRQTTQPPTWTASEDASDTTPCCSGGKRTGAPASAPAVLAVAPTHEHRSLTERLLHAARDIVGMQPVHPSASAPLYPPHYAVGSAAASPDHSPDHPGAMLHHMHGSHDDLSDPLDLSNAASGSLDNMDGIPLLDIDAYATACEMPNATDLLLLPEDPSDSLVITGGNAVPHQQHKAYSGSNVDGPLTAADFMPSLVDELGAVAAGHTTHSFGGMLPSHHQHQHQHQQQNAFGMGLGQLRSAASAPAALPTAITAPGSHAAYSMLSYGGQTPLVGYTSEDRLCRMSLKVFNCTPDMLLPAVRQELDGLLRVSHTLLEGYIRPGCVHVTLEARASVDDNNNTSNASGGLVRAVRDILDRKALGSVASEDMLVQSEGELVVVKRRRVVAVINTDHSAGILPRLSAVRPLAVAAVPNGGRVRVTLAGSRLSADAALVMCRQGGRNLTVEYNGDGPARPAAREMLEVGVLGLRPGCAVFEVQFGAFLGAARPLLVLPDEAAVEEIRQLETAVSSDGIADVDAFLRDAGFVAQFLGRAAAESEGVPVPNYTPELLCSVQRTACRLVATAAARGWVALVRYLLPAVRAGGQSASEAAACMDAACPGGCTLLHLAVGTGCPKTVRELAQWAASAAATGDTLPWAVDVRGAGGVTPLHVAALLPAAVCSSIRRELAVLSSAADKLWGLAQCDDGTTPEILADRDSCGGTSSGRSSNTNAKTAAGDDVIGSIAAVVSASKVDKPTVREWTAAEDVIIPTEPIHGSKARGDAKRQLCDHRIRALIEEVNGLPRSASTTNSGTGGNGVMSTVLALGMGAAALALHVLS